MKRLSILKSWPETPHSEDPCWKRITVPTDADLFGKSAYVEHKPDCPAGGAYSLNAVEAKCTCNFPVHVD